VRLRVDPRSRSRKRRPGQYLLKASNTIEIEGDEKPALIAETLAMLYERRKKAGS
jgi:hypothetical protein